MRGNTHPDADATPTSESHTLRRVEVSTRVDPAHLAALRGQARRRQQPLGHIVDAFVQLRFAFVDDLDAPQRGSTPL